MNINNDIQSFCASVKAPIDAKPAWKVLKVMADLLELPGFHYSDSTQVLSEVSHQAHKDHEYDHSINLENNSNNIEVIWQQSPYSIDALLRHSSSLQNTTLGKLNFAHMNAGTAKELKVKDTYLGVPVLIDNVADKCVFVNANHSTDGGKS